MYCPVMVLALLPMLLVLRWRGLRRFAEPVALGGCDEEFLLLKTGTPGNEEVDELRLWLAADVLARDLDAPNPRPRPGLCRGGLFVKRPSLCRCRPDALLCLVISTGSLADVAPESDAGVGDIWRPMAVAAVVGEVVMLMLGPAVAVRLFPVECAGAL